MVSSANWNRLASLGMILAFPSPSLPELEFLKKEPLSHVTVSNDLHSGEAITEKDAHLGLGGSMTLRGTKTLVHSKLEDDECDPSKVDLGRFRQWIDETGYWVGHYDFYQEDGTPHVSKEWNYPFHKYRGFITGNISGTKYRQRNVFLYPPQEASKCYDNPSVWGNGSCGKNGNMKVFFADQEVTTCSTNPELAGDVRGDYGDHFFTTTELIGQHADNAVLYQVWLKAGAFGLSEEALLFQSQLTTITQGQGNQLYRTRSAQEFEIFDVKKRGQPVRVSFYRERRVSKEEFYELLEETIREYNILPEDVCTWKNGPVGNLVPSKYQAGLQSCIDHLEQSFAI